MFVLVFFTHNVKLADRLYLVRFSCSWPVQRQREIMGAWATCANTKHYSKTVEFETIKIRKYHSSNNAGGTEEGIRNTNLSMNATCMFHKCGRPLYSNKVKTPSFLSSYLHPEELPADCSK